MAIKVYWGSGSPYSWRVLLTLEIKKLPYESHILQFSKEENRTPEYLALSPRGKIPALRDGEFGIYESLAIMTYLDRKYPEPPLFGRTAEEAGHVARAISEFASYLDSPSFAIVYPLYFGKSAEQADSIRAAVPTVRAELARLETTLAKTPWIVGTQVSAADLVVYPGLMSLLRAASKPEASSFDLGVMPLDQRYPALAAWTRRIEGLPGYERTYPPHWR